MKHLILSMLLLALLPISCVTVPDSMNEQENENVKASPDSSDSTIAALEKKITMLEQEGNKEIRSEFKTVYKTPMISYQMGLDIEDRMESLGTEMMPVIETIDDAWAMNNYETVISNVSLVLKMWDEVGVVLNGSNEFSGLISDADFEEFQNTSLAVYTMFYLLRAESYFYLEDYYNAVRDYDMAFDSLDRLTDREFSAELLSALAEEGMDLSLLNIHRQKAIERRHVYPDKLQLQPIQ